MPGGHLQTILPALYRRVQVAYERQRITLPDSDFLDLDWLRHTAQPKQVVIISHGLEGDSRRPYLAGMARHLHSLGLDVLAWHYRSCSGEMNRAARFYHLADTGDLAYLVEWVAASGAYEQISLVGFSAGGNVTLKYLGETRTRPPQLRKAVAISTPLDLQAAVIRMERWDSLVYNRRFVKTLRRKAQQKANLNLHPELASFKSLKRMHSIREFDEQITAPLHGFVSANAYYAHASAGPYLSGIEIPTLLINAKNDPFLSDHCKSGKFYNFGQHVTSLFPNQGGHCGFPGPTLQSEVYWSEWQVGEWLM